MIVLTKFLPNWMNSKRIWIPSLTAESFWHKTLNWQKHKLMKSTNKICAIISRDELDQCIRCKKPWFYGIPESTTEITNQIIKQIVKKLNIGHAPYSDTSISNRLLAAENKHRLIIAILANQDIHNSIFHKRKRLEVFQTFE